MSNTIITGQVSLVNISKGDNVTILGENAHVSTLSLRGVNTCSICQRATVDSVWASNSTYGSYTTVSGTRTFDRTYFSNQLCVEGAAYVGTMRLTSAAQDVVVRNSATVSGILARGQANRILVDSSGMVSTVEALSNAEGYCANAGVISLLTASYTAGNECFVSGSGTVCTVYNCPVLNVQQFGTVENFSVAGTATFNVAEDGSIGLAQIGTGSYSTFISGLTGPAVLGGNELHLMDSAFVATACNQRVVVDYDGTIMNAGRSYISTVPYLDAWRYNAYGDHALTALLYNSSTPSIVINRLDIESPVHTKLFSCGNTLVDLNNGYTEASNFHAIGTGFGIRGPNDVATYGWLPADTQAYIPPAGSIVSIFLSNYLTSTGIVGGSNSIVVVDADVGSVEGHTVSIANSTFSGTAGFILNSVSYIAGHNYNLNLSIPTASGYCTFSGVGTAFSGVAASSISFYRPINNFGTAHVDGFAHVETLCCDTLSYLYGRLPDTLIVDTPSRLNLMHFGNTFFTITQNYSYIRGTTDYYYSSYYRTYPCDYFVETPVTTRIETFVNVSLGYSGVVLPYTTTAYSSGFSFVRKTSETAVYTQHACVSCAMQQGPMSYYSCTCACAEQQNAVYADVCCGSFNIVSGGELRPPYVANTYGGITYISAADSSHTSISVFPDGGCSFGTNIDTVIKERSNFYYDTYNGVFLGSVSTVILNGITTGCTTVVDVYSNMEHGGTTVFTVTTIFPIDAASCFISCYTTDIFPYDELLTYFHKAEWTSITGGTAYGSVTTTYADGTGHRVTYELYPFINSYATCVLTTESELYDPDDRTVIYGTFEYVSLANNVYSNTFSVSSSAAPPFTCAWAGGLMRNVSMTADGAYGTLYGSYNTIHSFDGVLAGSVNVLDTCGYLTCDCDTGGSNYATVAGVIERKPHIIEKEINNSSGFLTVATYVTGMSTTAGMWHAYIDGNWLDVSTVLCAPYVHCANYPDIYMTGVQPHGYPYIVSASRLVLGSGVNTLHFSSYNATISFSDGAVADTVYVLASTADTKLSAGGVQFTVDTYTSGTVTTYLNCTGSLRTATNRVITCDTAIISTASTRSARLLELQASTVIFNPPIVSYCYLTNCYFSTLLGVSSVYVSNNAEVTASIQTPVQLQLANAANVTLSGYFTADGLLYKGYIQGTATVSSLAAVNGTFDTVSIPAVGNQLLLHYGTISELNVTDGFAYLNSQATVTSLNMFGSATVYAMKGAVINTVQYPESGPFLFRSGCVTVTTV